MLDSVEIISAEEFYTEKASTCCFTGHRRRDLPFGGDISKQGVKNLISTIHLLCHEAYGRGIRTFITGMAEGSDLICGSVIMDMMHSEDHSLLLKMASAVVVTGDIGDSGRYRRRNQFMVNNSSELIAIYKEKQRGSGTLQTINMARHRELDIHIIELDRNPQFYCE